MLSEKLLALPDPTIGLAACVHLPCGEMLLPLLLRAFPIKAFPPHSTLSSEAAIASAGIPRLRAYGPRDARGRVFNLMATCDATRGTAAAEAALKRRWSLVTQLVKACPPLAFCRARGGFTLLHDAAVGGEADVCRFLIRHCGVSVDAAPKSADCPTPLTLAVSAQHWDVAAMLLCEFGADPAPPMPSSRDRADVNPAFGTSLLHRVMHSVRTFTVHQPQTAAHAHVASPVADDADSVSSSDILDDDGGEVAAEASTPFAAELAAAAADGRWACVGEQLLTEEGLPIPGTDPAEAAPALDPEAAGAGAGEPPAAGLPSRSIRRISVLDEENAGAVHFLRLLLQRLRTAEEHAHAAASNTVDTETAAVAGDATALHDSAADAGSAAGATSDASDHGAADVARAAAAAVSADSLDGTAAAGAARASQHDAVACDAPLSKLQQALCLRDDRAPECVSRWRARRFELEAGIELPEVQAAGVDDYEPWLPAKAAAAAAGVDDYEPWLPAHACSALTPLGIASGTRCWGVVQTLLDAGAHPSSLRGMHYVPPREQLAAAHAVHVGIGMRAWRRRRAVVLSRAIQMATVM